MATPSGAYWIETASPPAFPALSGAIAVDVAVVGGGLVGVVAARLLKDEGLSVALIEGARFGQGVTGRSTAKITSQHNLKYTKLKGKFGIDGARTYAEANEAGLQRLLALAAEHGVDADIEAKPAYTYTTRDEHVGEIEEEAELARSLGFPASLTREAGLPFAVRVAMKWDDQAQFHPVKFVAGLAATIPGTNCHAFENSRVTDWDDDRVTTAAGTVRARHVIMATHLPLGQVGAYYAKTVPHMHAVIAGPAGPGPVPDGMYISVEQPRHSLRSHRAAGGPAHLVFTGPGFKPGQAEDERDAFAEIERFARAHFAVTAQHRWTNEDYTPVDGRPYVGCSSRRAGGMLVATGFDAWGISCGAAAAMMLADMIAGRDNPWLDLFDASRLDVVHGAAPAAKAGVEVAAHLIGGYLSRRPRDADALAPGQAAVIKADGETLAAYRADSGELHLVSAACSHMGCIVGWNQTDRTWDCPCHGSRFAPDGRVLHGPATTPLDNGAEESEQASDESRRLA